MPKKQPKSKPKAAHPKAVQAVVLFGVDEGGKPRAARFKPDNEYLLSKLARAQGLRMGLVSETKHAEIFEKLPVGRIHATGTGAVPAISQPLYEALNSLAGGDPGPISTAFPTSWAVAFRSPRICLARSSGRDGSFAIRSRVCSYRYAGKCIRRRCWLVRGNCGERRSWPCICNQPAGGEAR